MEELTQESSQEVKKSNSFKKYSKKSIVALCLIIPLSVLFIFTKNFYYNLKTPDKISQKQPYEQFRPPTPTPIREYLPHPKEYEKDEIDSITRTWKTCTNETYGFSIKYPADKLQSLQQSNTNGEIVPCLVFTSQDATSKEIIALTTMFRVGRKKFTEKDFRPKNIFGKGPLARFDYNTVKQLSRVSNIYIDQTHGYRLDYCCGGYGGATANTQTDIMLLRDGYLYQLQLSGNTDSAIDSYENRDIYELMLHTFQFQNEPQKNPITGWDIHTNEKYKFSFEYPSLLRREDRSDSFVARSEYSLNSLSVSVKNIPFEQYSYKDVGGIRHTFDTVKKTWSQRGFTRTNTGIEAYTIPFSDAGCSGDIIVIPHPSYRYVVEAGNLSCANIAVEPVIPAKIILPTETFLRTFRFMN